MEFNFTAYGMSSWSGASSYVLPAGRVLDDILFAGNIELSNYIGYNNIYSLSLFPVVTLTPTANTWAGPGPMDTWAVPEAPVMDPTSLLEQLSFAVLDAVLLPVNWVFVATTGTSLSQVVYDAYLAGAVDAANNFIQNGVDRVIDIAREVVTMIYGIGEEILTVLTIALSVIADAIGALAGLIALLVIQGIFFWVLTSIIRLGESIISSARGDSERARKILDKEGVA